MIKNYMETVVDHLLPTVLASYTAICTCERCQEDIKAIALNGLKPLYVATNKGEVYTKVNEFVLQFRADAISQLAKAAEIVVNNPSHD